MDGSINRHQTRGNSIKKETNPTSMFLVQSLKKILHQEPDHPLALPRTRKFAIDFSSPRKILKSVLLIGATLCLVSCTTTIPRQNPTGKVFPNVTGTALDGKKWNFPKDLSNQKVLLLVGYDQDAQFDIDRWLIGMDQKKYQANIFEVPTIKGWVPRLISGTIDEGMRSGIPEELWKLVVTVYRDAEKIINLTGNEDPLNARVIVLDEKGEIAYFYDRGFSVSALNKLGDYFPSSLPKGCL